MKKLIIDATGINKQIEKARDFSWKSGWRIPVYCKEFNAYEEINEQFDDENNEVTLSFGGWLSDNSYQPDALELASIKPYESEREDEDEDDEWEIDQIREYVFKTIEQDILDNSNVTEVEFDGVF